jgi:hypothetical protein
MDRDFILRRLAAVPQVRNLWAKYQVGSFETRLRFDAVEQPWYAYGVHSAAILAKRLGIARISALEFGVAAGRGLLILERLAKTIGDEVGVEIVTYGFDSGGGMPKPVDYRDLPHVWGQGYYPMDERALRGRLTKAQLVLGDVAKTVPARLEAGDMPPVGFVSFDLDYYSSTVAAFQIFEGGAASRLPRVHCYFDDISYPDFGCHNEYVGELLAIREFNDTHPKMKICPVAYLRAQRQRPENWNDQIFVCHDFAHPQYTVNVAPEAAGFKQIPLPG